jgi:hypothetical protein
MVEQWGVAAPQSAAITRTEAAVDLWHAWRRGDLESRGRRLISREAGRLLALWVGGDESLTAWLATGSDIEASWRSIWDAQGLSVALSGIEQSSNSLRERWVVPIDGGPKKKIDLVGSWPRGVVSLRHDSKRSAVLEAVDGEVRAVRREHERGVELLGQCYKCRIRVIHRKIRVLVEELPNSLEGCAGCGNQDCPTGQKKIHACGPSARHPRQQERRLCQDGLGGHDRSGPVAKGLATREVMSLTAIEKRDESAGIEQQFSGHAEATR